MAIQIIIWIQGLFSRFVTTGRYGKWNLNGHKPAAHTDLPDGGRHWKTSHGGGMRFPSAASFYFLCRYFLYDSTWSIKVATNQLVAQVMHFCIILNHIHCKPTGYQRQALQLVINYSQEFEVLTYITFC